MHIPQAVIDRQPLIKGLKLIHRGKVRDSYELPGFPLLMLVIASARCSIFDFVLNVLVWGKGEVLTAMNHFWATKVLRDFKTDLVACGAGIDQYIPEHLRGNIELQMRGTVVMRTTKPNIEAVCRGYLTGSGWKSYQKDRTVCGHVLPKGLHDGSRLSYWIFTPTTKADVGHDQNILADSVVAEYGALLERRSLQAAQLIAAYALERGFIFADTKFEFGKDSNGDLVLVDEKGTPDSSRFWGRAAWVAAQAKGKLPPPFDKEFVRTWGKDVFIDCDPSGRKRDPENPEDRAYVAKQIVPGHVVDKTTGIYNYINWGTTGKKLSRYQREDMGIAVKDPTVKIEVIVGSQSDMPQLDRGLKALESQGIEYHVHALSCHRNPEDLRNYLMKPDPATTAYIVAAGKFAALPGDCKAILCAHGHSEKPVIGVGLESKTESANTAAHLCASELPGQPVELDPNGQTYFGEAGFLGACLSAMNDEFLPRAFEAKPVQMNVRQFIPAGQAVA